MCFAKSFLALAIFSCMLSHVRCGGIPMAVGVQSDMCTPALTRFGSHELKQQFLAPTIAGDFVGCLGVSESSAGSDVANIITKAEKKGDDYVINGSKMWITNSYQADWICLLANTSAGPNIHMNKILICVPMDTKGITKQLIPNKLGMRCSDTCQIFFEDVVVPQSYRIGEEGKGFLYQMLQFQDERIVAAAFVPEIISKLIQETANYCYQREAFGKPLLDKQVIHFRMAELHTEAELLRSLLYRCTGQYILGKDVTLLASMLKLKGGRLIREASDSLLQFWGGMGFTDTDVSRVYRDTRILSIGGGADEVMLEIICKYMDTIPK